MFDDNKGFPSSSKFHFNSPVNKSSALTLPSKVLTYNKLLKKLNLFEPNLKRPRSQMTAQNTSSNTLRRRAISSENPKILLFLLTDL